MDIPQPIIPFQEFLIASKRDLKGKRTNNEQKKRKMENFESLNDISNVTSTSTSSAATLTKSYGALSTSSSAVSREIEQLRAEIRHLASATKKKQSNLAQRNDELEASVTSERSKKKDTESKLRKYANLAERIKATAAEKIERLEMRVKQLEGELRSSGENCFNTETKLLLAKEDTRQLEQVRAQHAQMSKQFLIVKSQLEHEKNERDRLEMLERPEHDFELNLAQTKATFQTQLTEKNVELEHLDERLRERSEKLAQALNRANETTRDNGKLKKRLEKEQTENSQHKDELTDCRVDLEKALDAIETLKREVKARATQLAQRREVDKHTESKLSALQADNNRLHQEMRVSLDLRAQLERKLVDSQEDAAISRITIGELEESLRGRVKQFDDLKETLKSQVAHDQKIELDGLRSQNERQLALITSKTRETDESKEKLLLLEESLTRTRSLNEQIQADYETNLGQTEHVNKQLAMAKEHLARSDGRLKEVALKLAQCDQDKLVLKKQVDLLTRKLKQKLVDFDNMGVELKSEKSTRVQLDEEVHALQLELRSTRAQMRGETERGDKIQTTIETLKRENQDLEARLSQQKERVAEWTVKHEQCSDQLTKVRALLLSKDEDLIEATSQLKLARSEIETSEKVNTRLIQSVETMQHQRGDTVVNEAQLKNELDMSRQLINRLRKECDIYKEFLTKTSSTEAKNTESLVTLTERNKTLATEKSVFECRIRELECEAKAALGQTGQIEQLKSDTTRISKAKR